MLMLMLNYVAAVLAADPDKDPGIDLNNGVSQFRLLAVGVLGLALIIVSVIGVFTAGRRGNASKGASIVGTVLICLIPAGIGGGLAAIALGHAFLGWGGFIG
jgi:high-affinity K+ transport system ATPase subunit B